MAAELEAAAAVAEARGEAAAAYEATAAATAEAAAAHEAAAAATRDAAACNAELARYKQAVGSVEDAGKLAAAQGPR